MAAMFKAQTDGKYINVQTECLARYSEPDFLASAITMDSINPLHFIQVENVRQRGEMS